MKKLMIALLTLSLAACGNTPKKKAADKAKTETTVQTTKVDTTEAYQSFGKKITADNALSADQMIEKFKTMDKGDTLSVKFAAPVASVCKMEGCWMKLSLADQNKVHVVFKDHAFFVPKDIENQNAIVHGKAYLKTISVERLKHLAKDAGKSEKEIAAITEPKLTYTFTADGVLLNGQTH